MSRERLIKSMSVAEFKEKFEVLNPGEGFLYYTGYSRSLAEDRVRNVELDRVADLALRLGTDCGVEIEPAWATNQDRSRIGTGQAFVVQRVNGIGTEYLIVKRRR